jgi:uncharacterized protein YacL
MTTIVIPDFVLIFLIGISLLIGIGIGFFFKRNKKYHTNKNLISNKIYRLFNKFKRSKWAVFGICWFIFLIIIFPIYGTYFIIDLALSIISLIIGLFISYRMMHIIMRKSIHTEYDIWAIRIKSIIFACCGIVIGVIASLTTYRIRTSHILPIVEPTPLTIFLWFIGIGMILFAGYMEFVFERKAGILVFVSKQKF